MTLTAAEVWRKYKIAAVPASGPHSPDKAEVVAWATSLEAGAGEAENSIIRLTVTGGTGNAIVATATETPTLPGNKLYLLTPTANNTGATTIAVDGAPAAAIKNALGSQLAANSLLDDSAVVMMWSVDHYQIVVSVPVDATGVLADALAARDAAEGFADDAAASAVSVGAGLGPIFSFEGDSLSDPPGPYAGTWPLKLAATSAFFGRGNHYQFATSGRTAAAIVGLYASHAGSVSIPTGREAYFFLWAGTNDLINAGSTGAATYNSLKSVWAAARADGYKVVAFTIHQMALVASNPTILAEWNALNTLILSDPTLYDFIIRMDLMFPTFFDSVNILDDLTHLTQTGYQRVAEAVAAAVLGVQSVPASAISSLVSEPLNLNGSMEVSQEYGGGITTLTASGSLQKKYVIDQWYAEYRGSFAVAVQQQDVSMGAFEGARTALNINVSTAQTSLGANDELTLVTPIAGLRSARLAWGRYSAYPVKVGFWIMPSFAMTVSGSVRNVLKNRSYPFSQAAAANTPTFIDVSIPGDQAGTWATSTVGGLLLSICLAGGSTRVGTAGGWAAADYSGATGTTNGVSSASNEIYLSNFMVVPGVVLPRAAEASRIFRPFDQELLLCKSNFQIRRSGSASDYLATLQNFSTTRSFGVIWNFPVEMVSAPTITVSAVGHISINGASHVPIAATALSLSASVYGAQVDSTVASGLVDNAAAVAMFNSTSGWLKADIRV